LGGGRWFTVMRGGCCAAIGGADQAFQAVEETAALFGEHGLEESFDLLLKLSVGGVLELRSGLGELDEDDAFVGCVSESGDHVAGFEAVDGLGDGGGLEVHASGELAHGDASLVGREQVEGHELGGAETGALEAVEVGGLDELPDGEPGFEEPCNFRFQDLSFHGGYCALRRVAVVVGR